MNRVYILEEYTKLIAVSNSKQKFEVPVYNADDILNFKEWLSNYYGKNVLSLETERKRIP